MPIKFDIAKDNMLEVLQLKIKQDKPMQIDPTISETQVPLYKLFIPNDDLPISRNIVFKSNMHKIDFNDVKN